MRILPSQGGQGSAGQESLLGLEDITAIGINIFPAEQLK